MKQWLDKDLKRRNAIYLQIANHINEQILLARWSVGDKMPSAREFANSLHVNPNTVMRAYEYLRESSIIYRKRGIGFFVAGQAKHQILKKRRIGFLKLDLPRFFKRIHLLGIPLDEIAWKYEAYLKGNYASLEGGRKTVE